jgi:hypothetical protein
MRRTFLSLLLLGALPAVAMAQSNKTRKGHGGSPGEQGANKQQGNKGGNSNKQGQK